ncbi:HTH domain-containing protein [Paludibacterium denitrificans]|uniref:HTH domain-containing protein n=1 Tax=Paludibacterium denitrificans TaxID=2675226 RepID=UPI001E5E5EB0|nr:HTH domain-containing protein [Paludibacterium denitrificans]
MSEHAFAVLRHLADGRFHSGEDIAQSLGCSRTLVWQAVHAIEQEFGLTVFSVRGQGYKLAEPFEWLDVASIRACLARRPMLLLWPWRSRRTPPTAS